VAALSLVWLRGCYNTVTINELSTLGNDEVIVYTREGLHYHLTTWNVTTGGEVFGKGKVCSATTKMFQHTMEGESEFTGMIVASTITEIKSSSSHLRIGAAPIFGVIIGIGLAFTIIMSK